jgi:hypothetical protein
MLRAESYIESGNGAIANSGHGTFAVLSNVFNMIRDNTLPAAGHGPG